MRICLVDGCNEKYYCKGYCENHHNQMRYHGKIKERNTTDPNEIVEKSSLCAIKLYNNEGIEIAEAIFDLKYVDSLKNLECKWFLSSTGYAETDWYDENHKKHRIKLHQFIIHLSGQIVPNGYEIDHKDGDRLNCLLNNLRICTSSQNSRNRKSHKNSSSKYKGVHFNKISGKWKAKIGINYKELYLGCFDNEIDAAKAYDIAAIKYFGEFARLNINDSIIEELKNV